MKKATIASLSLLTFLSIGAIFLFLSGNLSKDITTLAESPIDETLILKENTPTAPENIPDETQQEKTKEELVREKIESIKRRLGFKELIIAGDEYFRNDQLALALTKYLDFYKKNPNDMLILQKIGDTYFAMKKFGSALNYYNQISPLSSEQRNTIAHILFYTSDLEDSEMRTKLLSDLSELGLKQDEYFYYSNTLSCIDDFHLCKLAFQKYFSLDDAGETLKNELPENIREISFVPLKNIKNAIQNYRNFQVDEVYLKNAFIIGAWYSDEMYSIAQVLGEKLLEEKPDYKPVLKIVAQSYYELGNYDTSRSVFGNYYEIDDSDPVVAYMLGIINSKLREYVLANIYFYKSLDYNYEPSIDARRHIIYNFYLLKNYENMFKAFDELIQNDAASKEDLRVAIYYAILHERYKDGISWAQIGQKNFPESGDFYTYEGWILRDSGETQEANIILETALKLDPENPFVLINNAYNEKDKGNIDLANDLFQKIIELAPESDFASQARLELSPEESDL